MSPYVSPVMFTVIGKKSVILYTPPVMFTVIEERSVILCIPCHVYSHQEKVCHLMHPLSCLQSSGKRSVILCIPCHVYSHQEKVCHLMHPPSCLELLGRGLSTYVSPVMFTVIGKHLHLDSSKGALATRLCQCLLTLF